MEAPNTEAMRERGLLNISQELWRAERKKLAQSPPLLNIGLKTVVTFHLSKRRNKYFHFI